MRGSIQHGCRQRCAMRLLRYRLAKGLIKEQHFVGSVGGYR